MFMSRFVAPVLLALLVAVPAQAQTVLHTEPSAFSPVLVYESEGERCMAFGDMFAPGRQTCYRLDAPQRMVFNYTRMMMSALLVQPEPRRILIIGLGGGTLPSALTTLLPQARIDVVEIDPAVVTVATRYFGFNPSTRLRVHQADGRAFVEQAVRERRGYDLIMLDAFDYNYIPRHLMTQEFLTQVRGLLNGGGVLAANTFASSALYDRESATYGAVFGPYFNLRANNRVIIAVKGALPDDATLAERAAQWAPRLAGFGIDTSAELKRVTRDVRWPQQTAVLTDASD